MENKKKCPYCGELIMESARKCRYCHSWLVPEEEVKQPQEEVQRPQYAYEEEPEETGEVEIDEQTFRDNVPFSEETIKKLWYCVSGGSFAMAMLTFLAYFIDDFSISSGSPQIIILSIFGYILAPIGCCALIYALRQGLQAFTDKFNTWLAVCIVLEAIMGVLSLLPDASSDSAGVFSLLFLVAYAAVYIIVGRKLSELEDFEFIGRSFVAMPIIMIGGLILAILFGTDNLFGVLLAAAAVCIAPLYLGFAITKKFLPETMQITRKGWIVLIIIGSLTVGSFVGLGMEMSKYKEKRTTEALYELEAAEAAAEDESEDETSVSSSSDEGDAQSDMAGRYILRGTMDEGNMELDLTVDNGGNVEGTYRNLDAGTTMDVSGTIGENFGSMELTGYIQDVEYRFTLDYFEDNGIGYGGYCWITSPSGKYDRRKPVLLYFEDN